MDIQFKKYRKTVPTSVHPLTQADHKHFGGVIRTLERRGGRLSGEKWQEPVAC